MSIVESEIARLAKKQENSTHREIIQLIKTDKEMAQVLDSKCKDMSAVMLMKFKGLMENLDLMVEEKRESLKKDLKEILGVESKIPKEWPQIKGLATQKTELVEKIEGANSEIVEDTENLTFKRKEISELSSKLDKAEKYSMNQGKELSCDESKNDKGMEKEVKNLGTQEEESSELEEEGEEASELDEEEGASGLEEEEEETSGLEEEGEEEASVLREKQDSTFHHHSEVNTQCGVEEKTNNGLEIVLIKEVEDSEPEEEKGSEWEMEVVLSWEEGEDSEVENVKTASQIEKKEASDGLKEIAYDYLAQDFEKKNW
ncbi:hypothetical protein GH733_014562 [Mirounga leonina]|nr:hypothetical protein GH733_014562 [Mirounga leonina]